jgi:hypothetical protein
MYYTIVFQALGSVNARQRDQSLGPGEQFGQHGPQPSGISAFRAGKNRLQTLRSIMDRVNLGLGGLIGPSQRGFMIPPLRDLPRYHIGWCGIVWRNLSAQGHQSSSDVPAEHVAANLPPEEFEGQR